LTRHRHSPFVVAVIASGSARASSLAADPALIHSFMFTQLTADMADGRSQTVASAAVVAIEGWAILRLRCEHCQM